MQPASIPKGRGLWLVPIFRPKAHSSPTLVSVGRTHHGLGVYSRRFLVVPLILVFLSIQSPHLFLLAKNPPAAYGVLKLVGRGLRTPY